MSDYTIETIDLTDTSRLRVEVEQDSTNPRKDWEMLTGFVKIEGRGDSRRIDVEPVHDAPAPIRDAQERIEREEDVIRWARIFHGLHIEYDSEHGGYWFVDRASWASGWDAPADAFTLEKQAEIIESERETYRQWAEGEVYTIILERLETWCRLLDDGTADRLDTRDEWEHVDALGGNYLDDSYTAQHVADEHFELTPEEFIALNLPGSPLSGLALHTIDDIRAAEEDVPLINEQTGRLTPAGELYLREYQRHEDGPRETPAEPMTGASGEW